MSEGKVSAGLEELVGLGVGRGQIVETGLDSWI